MKLKHYFIIMALLFYSSASLAFAEDIAELLANAVYSEKVDEVKKVLKNNKITSLKKDSATYAEPFRLAVELGNMDIVKYFIDLGYDVKTVSDASYYSPIETAVMNDYLNIAKLLIDKGVDLAKRDAFGTRLVDKAVSDEMKELLAANTPRTILNSIEEGSLDEVKDLLKKGADINAVYEGYLTPLASALYNKQVDIIKYLMEKGAKPPAEADYSLLNIAIGNDMPDIALLLLKAGISTERGVMDSESPLVLAATKGYLDVVKVLAEKGADLYDAGYEGNSLEVALRYKYNDIAKYLIQKGMNVDEANRNRFLFLSIQAENGEFAKTLIKGGASPNSFNEYNQSLLHEAALTSKAMTELVVPYYSDVNVRDITGRTPLHIAVENNKPEVVTILLAKGAKSNLQNEDYQSPLQLALNLEDTQILDQLVKKGADLKQTYNLGRTLLHLAAKTGSAAAVSYLLDKGLNANAKDEMGNTALHILATLFNQEGNEREKAFILLDKGADVSLKNAYELTPYDMITAPYAGAEKPAMLSPAKPENIFEAVEQEKPQWVRQFISKGASINAADDSGRTPLGIALDSYYDKYMALWLINLGAATEGVNAWGDPYYKSAYSYGNFKLIKAFFEKGSPKKADEGLLLAATAYNEEAVRYFVEKGANVKARDEEQHTALYLAVQNNMEDMAAFLLQKGAPVNDLFEDKNTVLHLAVTSNYPGIVMLLLDKGANPELKNSENMNALEIAQSIADDNLIDIIKPYMKKTGK